MIVLFYYYIKISNPELIININEFKKNDQYYLNIEMSDYSSDNSFGVYNVQNNFIYTLKYNKYKNKIERICNQSMKSNIVQALLYSYYKKDFLSINIV